MKSGSKQAPSEYKDTYTDRVRWYNDIITKANRAAREKNTLGEKQGAMNQVIIDAIVELKKTTNPAYTKEDVMNDRDIAKKIDEFSRQMVIDGSEKFKREGKSETRSNIMKFFTSLKNSIMGEPENTANFLDDLYKEVVRSEEFKTNSSRKHMSSAVTKSKPEHSVAVKDAQKVDGKKIMKAGRENPDAVTQFNFDDLPRSTQENLRPSVHENLHPSTISVAPAAIRARSGRGGK